MVGRSYEGRKNSSDPECFRGRYSKGNPRYPRNPRLRHLKHGRITNPAL